MIPTIAFDGHSVCKGDTDFIPNVRKPSHNVSCKMRPDDLDVKAIVMRFRMKKNVGMQRLRSRHQIERNKSIRMTNHLCKCIL